MGLKWLITGGCGYIGTSLIRALVEESGHSIRVLDNLSVGSREDLGSVIEFTEVSHANIKPLKDSDGETQCELVVGDILDQDLAQELSQGADVIVHLAANTGVGPSVEAPRNDCNLNVIGTFNYLEAARVNKVNKFIFASSGAPAGVVEPPIHEELPAHPVSPYGASKLAGEGYCSAYYYSYGVRTIALRFGNVYGPGSKHKSSVVAKFIKLCFEGQEVEVYGDGTQTRDFIYIDDLIDALLKSSKLDAGGEVFQIASSQERTVNEVVEIIKSVFKEQYNREMKVRYGEKRLGDVKRNYSDTSKAKKVLGWTRNMEITDGIVKTIEYFNNEQLPRE